MTGFRFGGRRENRLRQLVAFSEARRQFEAADRAGFFVLRPAGTAQIAAYHAFNRHDLALFPQRRPTCEHFFVRARRQRHLLDIRRDDMMRHVQPVEPEFRRLIQHFPLVGNAGGQNPVESTDPIRADQKQ